MENEKLLLTAGILNNEREVEVYEWLALILPEYGTKPFNKRLETWLNSKSMERFGTDVYENWAMQGEDKTFPRVRFGLTKDGFTLKYELSFYYQGNRPGYNYDTKKPYMSKSNESERIFGLSNTTGIIESVQRIVPNRREGIEKMQSNLRYLPKLMARRDTLREEIREYNERISYTIADSMRIK